jgi:hypothetical protein
MGAPDLGGLQRLKRTLHKQSDDPAGVRRALLAAMGETRSTESRRIDGAWRR